VDWRALGLYDYPQIVKKPMDLSLVKKRVEAGHYKTVHEVADDVRLIWNNCMAYNADGSEFYVLAQGFAKRFEDKFAKLLKDYPNAGSNAAGSSKLAEPTNAEKLSFAKLLYKITKEELGKVINDLDDRCPEALTKNSSEDEVEINVDNISASVFVEVNAFVRKCAGESGNSASMGRKKKSTTAGADKGDGTSKAGGRKKSKA